jgi:hypothetical protein
MLRIQVHLGTVYIRGRQGEPSYGTFIVNLNATSFKAKLDFLYCGNDLDWYSISDLFLTLYHTYYLVFYYPPPPYLFIALTARTLIALLLGESLSRCFSAMGKGGLFVCFF